MRNVPLAELPGRPCPIAAALELVGERWALLVIREMALGATAVHRHRRAGTGAPRDRIAARLKALEQAGVVAATAYQRRPPRYEYRPDRVRRRHLIPVLDALLAWGWHHAVAADDPDRPTPLPHRCRASRNRRDTDDRRTGRDRHPRRLGTSSARAPSPGTTPGPSTAKGLSMAGIDYLRAMVDGDLPQPPIAGLMRVRDRRGRTRSSGIHLSSQTNPPTTRSARFTAV